MKFKLMCGDAIEKLRTLQDNSINTCVTSPPYYGLRDYGIDGQIGLEETPEEYITKLVGVFREVKRVLCNDGILWVNIGDSYNSSAAGNKNPSGIVQTKIWGTEGQKSIVQTGKRLIHGCKPKDLIGVPWMLAFALRADGWYLRQDIIWAKNNPMPESVKDRCTRSHEYIFMLTKNKKYWFDHEAMQEPTATYDENIRDRDHTKLNNTPGRSRMAGLKRNNYKTRNKRDVWRVGVCSTVKEAHFAVFPKELVEPCILAGCPEGGWVLDPFNGSGTTGIVATQNKRNYIGIDLNPEYIEITKRRIEKEIGNEKHEVSVR
jgi:DNA modification methylase